MMYEEFCEGVGMKVDRKAYERIEVVYMAFTRFNSKQAVYDFYNKHDMYGIETLYAKLQEFNELLNQRKRLEGEIHTRQGELSGIIGELNKSAMLCGMSVA